jgi:site-specific recombinase XerD
MSDRPVRGAPPAALPLPAPLAEPIPRASTPPSEMLAAAMAAADRYAQASRAPSTWRAYRADWAAFQRWCQAAGVEALPAAPPTVAAFIGAEADAGKAPSTLTRRLAAIRLVHLGAGLASPHDSIKVSSVLQGVRRRHEGPPAQKKAARDTEIRRMVDTVRPQCARGLRDRALLLFGFAGAFRRSELVAIDCHHLEEVESGLKVFIPRSKTDQEGKGRKIAILAVPGSDYCPVQALQDWLTVAEISDGAVFRRMRPNDKVGATRLSAASVALIVKEHAERAGLDPDLFSGHSLRRGFLTSAAESGATIWKMAEQSGHKSLDVLRKYVEEAELFDDHAGAHLLK